VMLEEVAVIMAAVTEEVMVPLEVEIVVVIVLWEAVVAEVQVMVRLPLW